MKTAFITGVNGQCGSYLTEYLLGEGYYVIGLKRRSSTPALDNILNVVENKNFELVMGDVTDGSFIHSCISKYNPDEIYNLAAQSYVHTSFDQPRYTFEVDTFGVLNILEAVRNNNKSIRIFQASTSEMFGTSYTTTEDGSQRFQDEETKFIPVSPYAVSKLAAHHLCSIYRKAYDMHISCGILFNNESPRRGKEFVTRKVTDYIGKLVNINNFENKDVPKLELGNLSACRDWGCSKDYVKAMKLMLSQSSPNDYVVSMQETHSIKELCSVAFNSVGLNWRNWVTTNEQHKRPYEVPYLFGKSEKIRKLGWSPTYTFQSLIEEMVKEDINKHSKR